MGTGFHPELTGRENVFLNGAVLGMSRAEVRAKFDEIVAFSGVEKFIDTPVKRYSSGMQVRLAFAVAAHLEPEILLVDEVLAVGDAEFQRKCLGKMGEIAAGQGRTVLFVSHQLGMVSRLCSRAILLSGGQVILHGETDKVVNEYIGISSAASPSFEVKVKRKPAFFSHAELLSPDGVPISEVAWHEPLEIRVGVTMPGPVLPGVVLGVGLDNLRGGRVTTWHKAISEYFGEDGSTIDIHLKIPPRMLVAGRYSLHLALADRFRTTIQIVESASPFMVVDTGSELAAYEGMHLGVVTIPVEWSKGLRGRTSAPPHGTSRVVGVEEKL